MRKKEVLRKMTIQGTIVSFLAITIVSIFNI
jgi:hypothetical protein